MRLALLLLCVGCAGSTESAPPGTCDEASANGAGSLVEGALSIGTGTGDDFRPLGDTLELVLGSQGGWMVTPTLEVDLSAMATDGDCVRIDVSVDLGDGQELPYVAILSELVGERWTSEPLQLFLSYDLAAVEGQTAFLAASLEDDGVVATAEATALLTNQD